jgi:two-component system, OmpR family, phosphate regulon response regulator PhoB
MAQVLLIEDDCEVTNLVGHGLRLGGHAVRVAGTGTDGLRLARDIRPDLVLLELVLPDGPGTEVCRLLKSSPDTRQIPVIVVSARSDEVDRVVSFELGADDHVSKPFSVRELLLRIERTLRRHGDALARDRRPVDDGLVRMESGARRVWVGKRRIPLTPLEHRLLEVLLGCRGQVMSRETLALALWGQGSSVCLRTVDAHIQRLRGRLGTAGACVQTVRSTGYRFISRASETAALRGPGLAAWCPR